MQLHRRASMPVRTHQFRARVLTQESRVRVRVRVRDAVTDLCQSGLKYCQRKLKVCTVV